MNSREIRNKFLDFFSKNGHQIVPSAPLVIKDDPTLMFTNAGMNQFKDLFLGNKEPNHRRIANTQKCLRVSGKHNDLEEVGIDTYHHTMFEMLGNWSFGDYFKTEAIKWAWQLLKDEYKLPADRMYATVFGGDAVEGLEKDDEAYEIWKKYMPEDRIIYGSKKDNFWEMGDTGPCGPCSEIHIDLRSDQEIKKLPGKNLVNTGHPLVIEIWNLVFIQFNRASNGKLSALPQKHVDTGMGFERLVMAIQGKKSNYETDVFTPLINLLEKESGFRYGSDVKTDIAMRVIADHIRAISFAVADGQIPSNVKAGYVIRRILRRAVRYGFTYLELKQPAIYKLVDVLGSEFRDTFPEINIQKDFIKKVIAEEETSFLRTLENGLKRFDQIRKNLSSGENTVDGKTVFELYDTFGFPIDLTALIAKENGLLIDEKGFYTEMEKQKTRSKQAAVQEKGDWTILAKSTEPEFVGYNHMIAEGIITRYREIKIKNETIYQLVFNKTPFYAESGGQVGDTGYIQSNGERIFIHDTKKENDVIIHFSKKLPSDPGAKFTFVVDEKKRLATARNHSATHLLHAALRLVLGPHVQQKGSLVNDKILRFDFSHFAKLTKEEIVKIEEIVNSKIRDNIDMSESNDVPVDEAKKMGAMALFGEKYGDFVRVISFDRNFSVELCGGTHITTTGKIGFFKVLSEGSVAAGIRRIEAITDGEAINYINTKLDVLQDIDDMLNNPNNVVNAIQKLMEEKELLLKEIEIFKLEKASNLKVALLSKVKEINGVNAIIEMIDTNDGSTIKNLAFQLRQELDPLFMVLASLQDNKPQLTVMLSDSLVKKNTYNAVEIIKELAKEISGGGGGQPFYATAGGKNPDGLNIALKKAVNFIHA